MIKSFSLPLRPSPRPRCCLISLPTPQARHESSARRHRKALNIAPAPSFGGPSTTMPTGSSGKSRQPNSSRTPPGPDQIIFNPPPSVPNVYHTPRKFLPRSDIRKALPPAPASYSGMATIASGTGDPAAPLAPPVSQPQTKSYHLGPEQIEEIRALRKSDEDYWTRGKLAEKFKCSDLFVGIVVQASEARLKKVAKENAAVMKRWGSVRRRAREERQIRRSKWVEEA
ncbi:MAG: hypothetical protein M1828_000789 [Chrysothrix sp. TS-e1954]|nr:MAG: hypothetical protein M1828_000789 [Chrysothrix sp. TS-e1954]